MNVCVELSSVWQTPPQHLDLPRTSRPDFIFLSTIVGTGKLNVYKKGIHKIHTTGLKDTNFMFEQQENMSPN